MSAWTEEQIPDCKLFCDQADEFLSWVRYRIEDLNALITDHEFIRDPKNRLLITVDFFDIFEAAFPQANPLKKYGFRAMTGPIRNKILRELIGRISLLFGLPSDSNYYPLWAPLPYVDEFYSCLFQPELISSDKEQLASKLIELDNRAQEEYGKDLSTLLEDARVGKADVQILEFIFGICPELFFIFSGAYERGMHLTRRLFKDNIITLNIKDWNLPERLRKLVYQNGEMVGLTAQDIHSWFQLFARECKSQGIRFRPSWQRDIEAIAITNHLNKLLCKENYRFIFVSSAHMVNRILRSNPDMTHWYDTDGKPIPNTTFFRGLDVFRFYVRFTNGVRTQVNPESIIQQAISDRRFLKEVIDPKNEAEILRFLSFRKNCQNDCAKDPMEFSKRCEGRHKITPDVKQLINNVNAIRRKLFEAHVIYSSNLFADYMVKDDQDVNLSATVESSEFARVMALLDEIRNLVRSRGSDIGNYVMKLKTIMSAEFRLWVAVSKLKTLDPTSDDVKVLFIRFTMFPFRIRFKNVDLLREVEIIQDLLFYPKQSAADSELRMFYATLDRIATGCLAESDPCMNFWGRKMELTSFDEDSLERHLAMMLLLLSLGNLEGAYRSAEQLAELEGIRHFRSEFRVLAAQARLREYSDNRFKLKTFPERENKIREIIDVCLTPKFGDDTEDYRTQYLAGYAAGFLARVSTEYRATAIRHCAKARDGIKRGLANPDQMSAGQLAELHHLYTTSTISMAYYMAIDALEEHDWRQATAAVEYHEIEIPKFMNERRFTAICMHNKGYTYFVLAQLANTIEERQKAAIEARRCFNAALRRRLDPAIVERVLARQVSSLQSMLEDVDSDGGNVLQSLVDLFKESPQKFYEGIRFLREKFTGRNKAGKHALDRMEKEFVRDESRLESDIRLLDEFVQKELGDCQNQSGG